MTGHAPEATVKAITEQIQKGITLMLPYEDVIWVGEELQRRFKLPYWQFALTATDANRFALRMARSSRVARRFLSSIIAITARWMKPSSRSMKKARRSRVPTTWVRKIDPRETTKVIEFNDIAALETVLSARDVAAVLAEPVMTNIGIIHPDPAITMPARDDSQIRDLSHH
jgi:glutamate-1-semialdehyde 2,1-aminomutase